MKKLLLFLTIAAVSAGSIKAVTETEVINAKFDAKTAKMVRYAFDSLLVATIAGTAVACTGPMAICTAATTNSLLYVAGLCNIATRIGEIQANTRFSKLLTDFIKSKQETETQAA